MSDVLSVRQLLEMLTDKMNIELNKFPHPLPDWEKVESFYVEMMILFNGTSRPIRCTKELQSCLTQFFCCIISYVANLQDPDEALRIKITKRWMTVLDDVGGLEIQNRFAFFGTILEDLFFSRNIPLWLIKELTIRLNQICEKVTYFVFSMSQLRFLFRVLAKWFRLLCVCGDFEFQNVIAEAILSTCERHRMTEVLEQENMSFDLSEILDMFIKLCSQKEGLKKFLFAINSHFNTVHSISCVKVTLENTVISSLRGPDGDVTWMHINYGFNTFSFNYLDQFVSVNFKDIVSILLLKYDLETENLISGIFLIQLTGECSYRFDSSTPIATSINKIRLALSNDSHLEFLKEEFSKLFGEKFKEYNADQIKEVLEEKDLILEPTPNLPFKTANRRTQKQRDPMTSSQGNQDSKLNNSLTSANTKSVSKKPVVYEKEETTKKHELLLKDVVNSSTIFLESTYSYERRRNPANYRYGKTFIKLTTVQSFDNQPDYKFAQDFLVKRRRSESPENQTIFGSQELDDQFDSIINQIESFINSPELNK